MNVKKDDIVFLLTAALDGQGIARHWWESVGAWKYPDMVRQRLGEIDTTVQRLKDIKRRMLNSGDSA